MLLEANAEKTHAAFVKKTTKKQRKLVFLHFRVHLNMNTPILVSALVIHLYCEVLFSVENLS